MVTVKDIAKYVGLSQSTVSIVLRGEGENRKISKKTQDKIWEASRELGYRTNIAARNLRAVDNTIYIAVYMTMDYRADYMVSFLRGLWEKEKQIDKKIEFVIRPYEKLEESFERSGSSHASVICNASTSDLEYLNSIQSLLPTVIYNRYLEQYHTVSVDEKSVGIMAAGELAKAGVKKVLFVTSPVIYSGMQLLRDSFQTAADERKIEVFTAEVPDSLKGGEAAAKICLQKYSFVDAVFSSSSVISQALLNEFIRERVEVPERYKILTIGSGDKYQEDSTVVPLSAIYNQRAKLAGMCVDIIIDQLTGESTEIIHREAEPVYEKRKSL